MSYTPLQLIAGSGLLANVGISKPTSLTSATASYTNLTFVQNLLGTISLANAWGVSNTTVTTLQTLSASNCPALSSSIPTAYANTYSNVQAAPIIPQVQTGGFGNLVIATADRYLGNGDVGKFTQVFSAAAGYQSQTTLLIYSSVNSTEYLGPSFTTMNDLITGDATQVSLAIPVFSADVARLGFLINLADLENFGTPAALLQQLSTLAGIVKGTIPCVRDALFSVGLSLDQIDALATPGTTTLTYTESQYNTLQKVAYRGLKKVKNTCLQSVLDIFNVTTPSINANNPDISMADLLDPSKIFPNSYTTLTVSTPDGPANIYSADGAINKNIVPVITEITLAGCDQLAKIVTQEQATGAAAVAVSLGQIKGIKNMTLPELAAAFAPLETLKGLDQVQDLSAAMPADVTSYYQNTFSTGSGDYGTFTIDDLLGMSSGYNVTNQLSLIVATLNSMTLTSLTSIYADMLATVSGTYGTYAGPVTIPSGPAAGVYANGGLAFTAGLIPAAQTIITNLISTYPTQAADLNNAFNAICTQIINEAANQTRATINFDNLTAGDQSSIMSFVGSLGSYGQQDYVGGPAPYLNTVADTTVRTGQAIVGALREGRNSRALGAAGISYNTTLPLRYPGPATIGPAATARVPVSTANPPPAVLAPPVYQTTASSTSVAYTVPEAQAIVTRLANPSSTATVTGPAQTAKILGVYDQIADQNISVIVAQRFSLGVQIRPASSAVTAVFSTTASSSTMSVKVPDQASNDGGVYYTIPAWMIPSIGPTTITLTVTSPGGSVATSSITLDVVASSYANTVTITQNGWFEHINDVNSGSICTMTITGAPGDTVNYTWPTSATSAFYATLDGSGIATVTNLKAPPVGSYVITVGYLNAQTAITQNLTVHG